MSLLNGDSAPHPGMVIVSTWAWRCERCEHAWLPRMRMDVPKVCPKCKSPYWDRPRGEVRR